MTAEKRESALFYISLAGVSAAIVFLASDPKTASAAAAAGADFCIKTVVPALFPFAVLSSIFVSMGGADALGGLLGPAMRIFGVGGSGASALLLGFIGGYPIGAKTVASLYQSGSVGKDEAEKLLAFSSNCGVGFIIGFVGAGIFGSAEMGAALYLIHILSALVTGLILRGRWITPRVRAVVKNKKTPFTAAFTQAVRASVRTMADVCGFVIIFSVLLTLLAPLLSQLGGYLNSIIRGFFEIANGASALSNLSGARLAPVCASCILGWGGLSVHCQTALVLSGSGLSMKGYLSGKACHSVIAMLFTAIYCSAPAPKVLFLLVFAALVLFFLLFAEKAVEKRKQL